MKNKPTVFLFILINLFLGIIPFKIFAYDALTTHPILTEIAVDFYNLFGSTKISDTEKQLIIKGSKEEDNNFRFVNHFYDPVFNKSWKFLGIQYLFPELTAKKWAKNPFAQALYDPLYLASLGVVIKSPVFSETNYSWQRGIYEYAKGNRIKAFETLGHILHLIQDMSVPEHTRENAHLSFLDQATSYYENYTNQKDINFYSSLKEKLSTFSSYIKKNNLDDYFDFLAFYSNNYFLSPDTIPPSKYKLPQIEFLDVPEINEKGEIEYFLYGTDENGDLFRLAKKAYLDWRVTGGFSSYTLNDKKVLSDYWQRLGLKSVLTSAGVIELFLKEGEKAKLDQNFIKKNEKNLVASIFQGINSFINDIFQREPEYILLEKDEREDNVVVTTTLNKQASAIQFLTTSTISQSPTTSTTQKITSTTRFSTTTLSSTTTKPPPTTKSTTTTTRLVTTTTKTTNTTINFSWCNLESSDKPLRKGVIFNEINWMGDAENSNHEWIEFKNISNQIIDLSFWQILDKDGQIKIVFPENTKLKPNNFLLLERTNDDSVKNIPADLIFVGAINNQNEGLRLFDNNCNLQDEVLADPNWPAGDNTSKRTMERKTDLSWQTSSDIGGTPKRENSSGYIIVDNTNSNSSGSTTISSTSPTLPPTTVSSTTTTLKPNYPKLLINEVKIAGKDSNGELVVKDEFIEIYNPNDYEVSLTGWYIQKKTKSGSDYSSLVTKSVLENKVISPRGYFVVGNILSPNSSFYDALWSESYTLAENNTIVLKNPNGEIVDKVGWGEVSDSETLPAVNPDAQQSIQRKKINGEPIDNDNNSEDFELLLCPNPKEREESCVLGESTENQENSEILNPFIKNFSWHYFDETKSKIVIEFDVDFFPFIPNTTSTVNNFFALAFYFNQDVPVSYNALGEYDSYFGNRYQWKMDTNSVGLVLKYPDCQGYELLKSGLIFTTDDDFCHAPGDPWGVSYRIDKLPSDNHFIIEVTGTTLNPYNADFSDSDYITIGFYGNVYPSYLKLIYPDNHRYYFQSEKFYHFPKKINNFEVSFSNSEIINTTNDINSTLYFSFDKGEDEDLNDELTYEIQYVLKTEGDTISNNYLTREPSAYWPAIHLSQTNFSYDSQTNRYYVSTPLAGLSSINLPVDSPTTLYFAVRAKDKMGLISPLSDIKEITILPPPPPPPVLSSFISNIRWYFDSDNKAYVEFDIIKNGKVPSNYVYYNYKIAAGLDYDPGAGFAIVNLSPIRVFIYPRRANRDYTSGYLRQSDNTYFITFSRNQVPSLTHYKISPPYICLPEGDGIYLQCFNNDKQLIVSELSKRNKSLEDLYLFFAYGVCDHMDYGCVWFNTEDLSNPSVFYLER